MEEGFNTDNKEILKPSYKKGDIISLPDLLFTENRDYLVKNNSEQVYLSTELGNMSRNMHDNMLKSLVYMYLEK